MEYRDCSWNLTCSNVTSIGSGSCEDNCTSGCFCANQTVLYNGVCSNATLCSGTHAHIYNYNIRIQTMKMFCVCCLIALFGMAQIDSEELKQYTLRSQESGHSDYAD